MVDFVIGDVCVDVPAGISLKTSEDGSCVTLDFSSGYSGKLVLRKLIVQRMTAKAEIVGLVRKETEERTKANDEEDIAAACVSKEKEEEKKAPENTPAKDATEQEAKCVPKTAANETTKVVAEPAKMETVYIESNVATISSDKMEAQKPAEKPTVASKEEGIPGAQEKRKEKQKKSSFDEAGSPNLALASTKRRILTLNKPKKQMRMSDFGLKDVPKATSGAEHAYKLDMAVNWQKSDVSFGGSPRCGATAVLDSTSKKVYVAGGLSEEGYEGDLWILDLANQTWSQGTSGFKKRAWHTMSIVKDKMLVFGGQCDKDKEQAEDEDDDTQLLDDLTIFDEESGVWYQAYTTGEAPCARSGHSATPVDNKLVVFGGMNDNGWMNDVHVLDTTLFSWSKIKTKGSPMKARAYHSAVLIGHKIVFFGGIGRCNWAFKEIYSLDTRTWKWTEHSSLVVGEPPAVRVGQVVSALPDGKSILVYGGHNPDDPSQCYDDCSILDTNRWSWVSMPTGYMNRPSPRAGHCGIVMDGKLTTFCGQNADGSQITDTMWQLDVSGTY